MEYAPSVEVEKDLGGYCNRHNATDEQRLWENRKNNHDRFAYVCVDHECRGNWVALIIVALTLFAYLANAAMLGVLGKVNWSAFVGQHPFWFFMGTIPAIGIVGMCIACGMWWLASRCYAGVVFGRCLKCRDKYLYHAMRAANENPKKVARRAIVNYILSHWWLSRDEGFRSHHVSSVDHRYVREIFEEIAGEVPGYSVERSSIPRPHSGGDRIDICRLTYVGIAASSASSSATASA